LLTKPPAVTTTFPFVAPVGTAATILVALQLVGIVGVPLKVTALFPCVTPKPVPRIVTGVPAGPEFGIRDVMVGGMTVKLIPLLATPFTVTTTFPVVAPLGTGTKMSVTLQLVGAAAAPLKVTVLLPCEEPKFAPVILTDAPTCPNVGLIVAIFGPGPVVVTVNNTPLLATPATVTTTLPVVAPVGTEATIDVLLQLEGPTIVPLNAIVLVPWAPPKFVPVIVTKVPTGPEVGLRLEMFGVGITTKSTPLLAIPATVATILPVVAPAGTDTAMLVALQLVGVATVPLNVTVLVPWLAPKFDPEIVTGVPAGPDPKLVLVMVGVGRYVKAALLLATPATKTLTVTTVFAVKKRFGTGTAMLVGLQLVGVAAAPLNVTVLVPCVAPRFAPAIVTAAPTGPEVGFKLLMLGGAVTVNATPLLARPLTVIATFPVVAPAGTGATMLVALQLVGVVAVPLNVTVLVPWDAPKFVPVIVTELPTGPEVGLKLVMLGAASTVKLIPLLATPDTATTTLPVVAPAGTGATMLVALQLVGVATVPLNVTVLVPWVAPKFVPVMVTNVPTAAEVGDKLVTANPASPVPVRFTTCGPLEALSVRTIVPVRVPTAVGVNVTLIAQFDPAASVAAQVVVSA
jgi:hypothetical protein